VAVELLPECRGRNGGAGGGASGTHHRGRGAAPTGRAHRGHAPGALHDHGEVEADGEAEADVDRDGGWGRHHGRRGPWSGMLRRPAVRA
jgi:hypothetical protein